ncbi:EamA family transporter [Candidatus Margulisiibacteriota bacterium]
MRLLLTLVALYSLLLGSSQVILKLGINSLGGLRLREIGDIVPILIRAVTSAPLMLGVGLMASSFFMWFYILSLFPLSKAFPLSSMTFVFTIFMSALILGEKLTIFNVLGTFIICFGVFVLLYSPN